MSSLIEPAKSSRASCRKCKEKIIKDELRFGYEDAGEEFTSIKWFHLKCDAEQFSKHFLQALEDTEYEVPDEDELKTIANANKGKQKPAGFPYAERAPSGRSGCLVCDEKIPKDEIRIAVEREIDTGSFTRMGAGYLHMKCAPKHEDVHDLEELFEEIEENSTSLKEDDLEELGTALGLG